MRILKVASHPRSGTHFLMRALYENFYAGRVDLGREVFSHSHTDTTMHRVHRPDAQLFGGHSLQPNGAPIYIYRDGRDVITSMYNSPDFHRVAGWERADGAPLPPVDRPSFGEYLRRPLRWRELCRIVIPPAERTETPAEHWLRHCEAWVGAPGVFSIRYETLCREYDYTLDRIRVQFGLVPLRQKYIRPGPVGWFPYRSKPGTWREFFSDSDLEYFHRHVPRDCPYLDPMSGANRTAE